MLSSLQEGLLACARKQDQTATYIHLAGLRDSGKSKQEVYAEALDLLKQLRSNRYSAKATADADALCDVMDMIVGFCSPQWTVWTT